MSALSLIAYGVALLGLAVYFSRQLAARILYAMVLVGGLLIVVGCLFWRLI